MKKGVILIFLACVLLICVKYFLSQKPRSVDFSKLKEAVSGVEVRKRTEVQLPKFIGDDAVDSKMNVIPMPVKMEIEENEAGGPRDIDSEFVEYRITAEGLAVGFGDIIFGKPESDSKSGFIKPNIPKLWPTNEIPVLIENNLEKPDRIIEVLQYFNENTPIEFVPHVKQKNAIIFKTARKHCYSYLGMMGGIQPIMISKGCGFKEITHEIMHALGFIHEQSRTDRDNFLEIIWENISEEFVHQFRIVPKGFMLSVQDSPFDFRSIMLYRSTAFGKTPGLVTIRSLSNEPVMPSSDGFSERDLERLENLYSQN